MSPEQFKQFERTGIMPATTETFISPILKYSSKYNGISDQIVVNPGTLSKLEIIVGLQQTNQPVHNSLISLLKQENA